MLLVAPQLSCDRQIFRLVARWGVASADRKNIVEDKIVHLDVSENIKSEALRVIESIKNKKVTFE